MSLLCYIAKSHYLYPYITVYLQGFLHYLAGVFCGACLVLFPGQWEVIEHVLFKQWYQRQGRKQAVVKAGETFNVNQLIINVNKQVQRKRMIKKKADVTPAQAIIRSTLYGQKWQKLDENSKLHDNHSYVGIVQYPTKWRKPFKTLI